MAITITKLVCFQKVAELENVSKAASVLNYSQPALSRTISSLENDLGTTLFDKTGRNVILNKNGVKLKVYVDRILSDLDTIKKVVVNESYSPDRIVTISLLSASSFIPGLISLFNKKYPAVKFEILQEKDNPDLNNSSDLKIFSSVLPTNGNNSVTLLKERILIALPEHDPLAKKDKIKLNELEEKKFLMLNNGKNLRKIVNHYCNSYAFFPRVEIESDSPHIIREFIKAGMGVAFVPEYTWGEVSSKAIVTKSIESINCVRYICLSWSENLSKQASEFKNFLIKNFKSYVIDMSKKE